MKKMLCCRESVPFHLRIYYSNIDLMFLSIFDLLYNIAGRICYVRKDQAHFIFFLSFKKCFINPMNGPEES